MRRGNETRPVAGSQTRQRLNIMRFQNVLPGSDQQGLGGFLYCLLHMERGSAEKVLTQAQPRRCKVLAGLGESSRCFLPLDLVLRIRGAHRP